MSKSNQASQDTEQERIEGEEEFMNEPKTKECDCCMWDDMNFRHEPHCSALKQINWNTERSEQSERALEQMDRHVNPNPLD